MSGQARPWWLQLHGQPPEDGTFNRLIHTLSPKSASAGRTHLAAFLGLGAFLAVVDASRSAAHGLWTNAVLEAALTVGFIVWAIHSARKRRSSDMSAGSRASDAKNGIIASGAAAALLLVVAILVGFTRLAVVMAVLELLLGVGYLVARRSTKVG
jgi:hypothetical protein